MKIWFYCNPYVTFLIIIYDVSLYMWGWHRCSRNDRLTLVHITYCAKLLPWKCLTDLITTTNFWFVWGFVCLFVCLFVFVCLFLHSAVNNIIVTIFIHNWHRTRSKSLLWKPCFYALSLSLSLNWRARVCRCGGWVCVGVYLKTLELPEMTRVVSFP